MALHPELYTVHTSYRTDIKKHFLPDSTTSISEFSLTSSAVAVMPSMSPKMFGLQASCKNRRILCWSW